LLHVEADVALLLFEGIGYPSAKVARGFWKGEERIGHDLDGQELVTSEAVHADRSLVGILKLMQFGEFVFAGVFLKMHARGAGGGIPEEGSPGGTVCQLIGLKKLFL
jgi:hypothetical protein